MRSTSRRPYGEHRLRDALMKAGEPHGLRPFGHLEPQRILRLQKMHILVGQDTDSESTPFGAAMTWIVKLDKEQDWIGKWALEHYNEATPATELVGFTLANGYVPTEGAVVVDGQGVPAGQVTSARHSPVLGRTIGMAWVPTNAVAKDSAKITISDLRASRPRPRFRPSPSMTPTARCCAREPGFPVARRAGRELRPGAGPCPLARWRANAADDGARFEVRDGWNDRRRLQVGRPRSAETVGWADMSQIEKLELQGPPARRSKRPRGLYSRSGPTLRQRRRLVVPADADAAIVVGGGTGDPRTTRSPDRRYRRPGGLRRRSRAVETRSAPGGVRPHQRDKPAPRPGPDGRTRAGCSCRSRGP